MAGGETTFLKVKNRAYSKLVTAIDDDDVSVVVTAGQGARFPSTYPFDITIEDEIMRCTSRSTDTLTVTRAQQSTSAAAHSKGKKVALNITAKSVTDLNTAVNFIEKYADYALAFYGVVTTYTDTTHFKVSGLAGLGASTFLPASGTPYEIFVFKADGAAPQGEQTPVVAYTTADGTFQHAAFTSPLAVDDEVLIIHPLLASLGTKATAAATGAVTTTDYAMAYIKQIVTELIVVDGIVDAIKAVTDAIPDAGALTALLASIASILEDTGTTLPATLTTIDTVVDSIIADYLAHATYGLDAIKTLLNTFPAILDTLDTRTASIVTDYLNHGDYGLNAIVDLINACGIILTTLDSRTATIVTDYLAHASYGLDAIKSALNTANAIIPDLRSNLVRWGVIDSIDGNSFVSADLAGLGVDAMHGWYVYVMQADDAAPEGEYRLLTDYANDGDCDHNAFSVALEVGDRVQLIHPVLYHVYAATRGSGVESLESLSNELDAELDFARVQALASPTTLDGTVQTIYSNTQGRPFYFAGGFISWDSGAWAGGESVTINVDVKVDGTNWENMWTITIAAAASPLSVAVPAHANSALLNIPMGFWNSLGVRVTVEQTVEGAGYGVISHEFHDGVPGS